MKFEPIVVEIKRLFKERGSSLYGGEAVTQLEHALQAATLAETSCTGSEIIAAALLHDIGHLLHDLPVDAPDDGIDDDHEQLGWSWLQAHFSPEVIEPIRLHVAAKRYLCAVDVGYRTSLSAPSRQSLKLQGGPFTEVQVRKFERHPYFKQAVELRRWDDLAKVVGLKTPDLGHFLEHVNDARQAVAAAIQ